MNLKLNFRNILLLLVICMIGSTVSANNIKVAFTDEKVNDAIARASEEGKLVFMDFYASWCTPCKWMDKTTFTDADVIEAIDKSFIAIKVNIDDVQGFEMKNKYEINYLPTILILNSKGNIVERVEETLTADNLVKLLKIHDQSENKVKIKHNFNTSPRNMDENNDSAIDPWKITKEEYFNYQDIQEKRNYRVQVGVYSSYESAHAQVANIRETFFEPVVVVNDFRDGKVLFKVMLGQFQSISEADSFTKILKNEFGIEGIVN